MKHCYHCGGSLIPISNCPQCSAPTQPHYAFCTECGCRLIKPAVQATRPVEQSPQPKKQAAKPKPVVAKPPKPKRERVLLKRHQVTMPEVYADALQGIEKPRELVERLVTQNIDRLADIEPDNIPAWARSKDSVKVVLFFPPVISNKIAEVNKSSRRMRSLLLEHLGLPINGYVKLDNQKRREEYHQPKPVSSKGRKLVRLVFTQQQFDQIRIVWGNHPQNAVAEYINANTLKHKTFGAIPMARGRNATEEAVTVVVWLDDAVHERLKSGDSFMSEKVRWMLFEAKGAPA